MNNIKREKGNEGTIFGTTGQLSTNPSEFSEIQKTIHSGSGIV